MQKNQFKKIYKSFQKWEKKPSCLLPGPTRGQVLPLPLGREDPPGRGLQLSERTRKKYIE
jgi:hypothetical protein